MANDWKYEIAGLRKRNEQLEAENERHKQEYFKLDGECEVLKKRIAEAREFIEWIATTPMYGAWVEFNNNAKAWLEKNK